jgi:hypothetical protein
MKYFKIKWANGDKDEFKIVKGKDMLAVIKREGLYKPEHKETRCFELTGEQLAIAQSNENQ